MALTIYPNTGYDSFISEEDATVIISANSVNADTWLALSVPQREVYLRISTDRILNVVSFDPTNIDGYLDITTYVAAESTLPKACALMAIHDVVYSISAEATTQTGLVSREVVDEIEVHYYHDGKTALKGMSEQDAFPFPVIVRPYVNSYGANIGMCKLIAVL